MAQVWMNGTLTIPDDASCCWLTSVWDSKCVEVVRARHERCWPESNKLPLFLRIDDGSTTLLVTSRTSFELENRALREYAASAQACFPAARGKSGTISANTFALTTSMLVMAVLVLSFLVLRRFAKFLQGKVRFQKLEANSDL